MATFALRPAPMAALRGAPRLQRVGRLPAKVVAGAVARRGAATALRAVRADGPSAEVVRPRRRRARAWRQAAAPRRARLANKLYPRAHPRPWRQRARAWQRLAASRRARLCRYVFAASPPRVLTRALRDGCRT
jgi:hypothetical protein